MALSPNGMSIATGSRDSTVSLWDIEKGEVIVKWKGHAKAVRSVCWSPGGEQVVSGGWDGTARVWDVENGHGKPVLGLNPIETGQESVLAVSYSPKGTQIATGGVAYSGIKIWDAKTGKLLHTVDTINHTVWSLAWTLDEKKLISGISNGSIYMFNTATWQLIRLNHSDSYHAGHHNHVVHAISVSHNDRLFVSTSSDGTARLWNLATNLQVGPPLRHKNDVKCAAFSADGKLLFTACDDENAYVWDIQAILKEEEGLKALLSIPDVSVNTSPTVSQTDVISFAVN
jgi:WD40 repeat protein